jgi:hypothetical protein
MIKIGSFSRTMRTAMLLATVLIPAPLLAEPAATPRQMLALAQSQAWDHAVKGEVEKITRRDLSLTEKTSAAPTLVSSVSQSVAIPTITAPSVEAKIETPNPPVTGALREDVLAVAQANAVESQHIPSIQVANVAETDVSLDAPSVHLPPVPATAVTARFASTAVATALPQDAAVAAPAAPKVTPLTEGSPVAVKPESRTEAETRIVRNREAATRPVVKTAPGSIRVANTSPTTPPRHPRANGAIELDGSDIPSQLRRIANRPDVRALMAQYGLN